MILDKNSSQVMLFDRIIPRFNWTLKESALIGILWYFLRITLEIIFMTLLVQWLIFTRGNFLKYSKNVEYLPDNSNFSPSIKAQIKIFKRKFWDDSAINTFCIILIIIWGYPFVIIYLFTTNGILHTYIGPLVVIYLIPLTLFNSIVLIEPFFDLGVFIIIIFLWKKLPVALKNIKPAQYTLPTTLINMIDDESK